MHCWGHNENGQLGYGHQQRIGDNESPLSAGPVELGPGRTAIAITAGQLHTCVILDDRSVRCWGRGAVGILGHGEGEENIGDDELPTAVPPVYLGQGAVAISAGTSHTCAILEDRTVRCWGAGATGQLGYGAAGSLHIGDDETPGEQPPVSLGGGAVAISAGGDHSCAILASGALRCWGRNMFGELGLGHVERIGDNEKPTAAPVVDLDGHGVIQVASGVRHTCAVLDDGTARCWGDGKLGVLGYGNTTSIGDNETTAGLAALDLGGRGVIAMTAGENHSCALLDDGTMRCWGDGERGKLGYGNAQRIGDDEVAGAAGPVPLGPDYGSGRYATSIATGARHTCALLDDGSVRCWGAAAGGALGLGDVADIGDNELPSSVPPVALGGRSAVALAAGETTTCALLDEGELKCWGNNNMGQLGYGNTIRIGDDETPAAVGTVELAGKAVAVEMGDSHTCALREDGALLCWGRARFGALGYGSEDTIGDDEPPSAAGSVPPIGAHPTSIAAGGDHTCAILETAFVRCWGQGEQGQLGLGHTEIIGDDEPADAVAAIDLGGDNALSVTSGDFHSCAIVAGNRARCWGLNQKGQLGYGHTDNVGNDETPGSVGTLNLGEGRHPILLDGGRYHTCALLDDGTVRCWGDGSVGALGTGDTEDIGDDESPDGPPVDLFDDPPAAVDDWDTVTEDAIWTAIDVLQNDEDPDGGAPSVESVTQPQHGSAAVVGGGAGVTYTPDPDYCGPDSFQYTLSPGGSTATVSIEVTCVDDAPVAVDDSAAFVEDGGAAEIEVLVNDTDIDAGPMTVASTSDPEHGTVAVAPGGESLSYEPHANYCGTDSFEYTLAPGGATATVSVEVTCVDDSPIAVDDSETLDEDSSATEVDVLGNDTDIDAGPMAVASTSDPDHGTVSIAPDDESLSYEPDPNYCGADSFEYTLAPGGSTATISIEVTCVDDVPVAVDDSRTLAEDADATEIDVLANDTDVDGGPISIDSATQPDHGTVSIAPDDLSLSYHPDFNYCGADSFEYTLAPGGSTATVALTVTCVDDVPVAVDDSRTLAEDAGATEIDVLANDTDVDAGPIAVDSASDPEHGTVAVAPGGESLSYEPDPNYCGSDSFEYTLAPGGSTATVALTVSCVEDNPVAVDDNETLAED